MVEEVPNGNSVTAANLTVRAVAEIGLRNLDIVIVQVADMERDVEGVIVVGETEVVDTNREETLIIDIHPGLQEETREVEV